MAHFSTANITFGAEFEFVTPCPLSKLLMWGQIDPASAARMGIAEEMVKRAGSLPIACICEHSPKEFCCVCKDAPENELHDYFLFQHEYLLADDGVNVDREWPGVEMSTPAFKHGELKDGLPSVKMAISALRTMDARLSADQSCGLHVHVGIESGLTLLTAKKAVALVMVLEESVFQQLCAPSRLRSVYSAPVCWKSYVGRSQRTQPIPGIKGPEKGEPATVYLPPSQALKSGEWNRGRPAEFYRMLEAVWNTQSLQELSLIVSQSQNARSGLAICLRDGAGNAQTHKYEENLEGTSSTVEFRYSQMSFDMKFIQNWITLVSRVIEVAQLNAKDYKESFNLVLKQLDESEKSGQPAWPGILKKVLDLSAQIPDWKQQLELYKKGEEISHLDDQLLLKRET